MRHAIVKVENCAVVVRSFADGVLSTTGKTAKASCHTAALLLPNGRERNMECGRTPRSEPSRARSCDPSRDHHRSRADSRICSYTRPTHGRRSHRCNRGQPLGSVRPNVSVDAQFFSELDSQLGESRGPNGEPSSSDFLLVELPTLSEVFAERFEELPALYPDRGDYRYLTAAGLLVPAATITAQLVPDGSVILFGVDIDLRAWPKQVQLARSLFPRIRNQLDGPSPLRLHVHRLSRQPKPAPDRRVRGGAVRLVALPVTPPHGRRKPCSGSAVPGWPIRNVTRAITTPSERPPGRSGSGRLIGFLRVSFSAKSA